VLLQASVRRLGLRVGLVRLLRLTTVRLLLVLATAAALMVAAACDGADEQMETAPVAPTTAPDAPAPSPDAPTPTANETPTGEASGEIEAAARRLLAEELGEGNYTLVGSEAMDWSDASLGCPQEGYAYAQVITPGYKLVFDLLGASHAVHSNADGSHMVVCRDALGPSPDTRTPAANEPPTGEAPSEIEAAARRLLAEEVGDGDYTLVSSEAMDWSDASLGCPQEGFAYAQVITPGYKLVFDMAGASQTVHSNADGSHMVICPDAPAR